MHNNLNKCLHNTNCLLTATNKSKRKFTTAENRDRIEWLMSRLRRGAYLPPGHPSYEELAGKADVGLRLLKLITSKPNHVLSKFLPYVKYTGYNLRPRANGYELPTKDTQNFISRTLYQTLLR